MQVTRLRTSEEFERLAAAWSRWSQHNQMTSLPWLRAWWDGYGEGRELYVLVATRSGEPLGALPLCRARGAAGVRWLSNLGGDRACSDDMGLLCAPADAPSVASAIAVWLRCARGENAWDQLELDGLEAESNVRTKPLAQAFDRQSMRRWVRAQPSGWAVDLRGGWTAYTDRLSRRVKKMYRDLERIEVAGDPLELRFATTMDEARAHLLTIAELHQRRWDAGGIEGCFSSPCFRRFMLSAVAGMWPLGTMRLVLLRRGAAILAGCVMLCDANHWRIYLVGMDTTQGERAPGWQMNLRLIRQAHREGIHSVDYLRGDEPYKLRLGATPYRIDRWWVSAPRTLPRLQHATLQTGIHLRDWWAGSPISTEVPTS